MSIDDLGKDLRSVQALQRKHEGLERDLAALGDKIRQLDELGRKLMKYEFVTKISVVRQNFA